MPMKDNLQISSRLSPEARPGAELAARAVGELTPTRVALRDLHRYYALLERARLRLRGRFQPAELAALAHALQGMALVDAPELFYLVPDAVAESVQEEQLCEMAGIADCEDFLERVRGLDLAERYALVDAISTYLERPQEERGEAAWRELGMI